MGHPQGKVEKVEVYIVGNRQFTTLDDAKKYEQSLVQQELNNKILKLKTAELKKLAKSYEKTNPYFQIFNGGYAKGGVLLTELSDALRSLFTETPQETLKVLISLDEVDFEEDGPIREELPIDYSGDEGDFTLRTK